MAPSSCQCESCPPLLAERADGRMPVGCATAIAAWILHLRGHGAPVKIPARIALFQHLQPTTSPPRSQE
jgi:hypothetical protein